MVRDSVGLTALPKNSTGITVADDDAGQRTNHNSKKKKKKKKKDEIDEIFGF